MIGAIGEVWHVAGHRCYSKARIQPQTRKSCEKHSFSESREVKLLAEAARFGVEGLDFTWFGRALGIGFGLLGFRV